MNFKTTTLLLVALLVVGVAVILVQLKSGKPGETADENAAKVLKLSSSDVKKVLVKPAEGKTLVLEKSGSDWRMIEPINAAANSVAVDALVNGLTGLKSRGQIEPSENAAMGLEHPRYIVEVTSNDGKTKRLKIGNRQAVGDNLYVMLEGDAKGSIVPGDLSEQLEKPYTDFRQMKLVTANSMDIKQIEIAGENGKISLQKNGESWEMTEPEKMPVESSEASNIASALSFLNATTFVDEQKISSLLNPNSNPPTTVWFSTAVPSTQPATTRPAGVTLKVGGFDSVMKKNVYVFVSDPPALAKVP